MGKLTFRQFGVDKMTHWDVDWGCMLGRFAMDYCRGDYRAMPHQDNSRKPSEGYSEKYSEEDFMRAAEEAYEEVFGDSGSFKTETPRKQDSPGTTTTTVILPLKPQSKDSPPDSEVKS